MVMRVHREGSHTVSNRERHLDFCALVISQGVRRVDPGR
jgi:hypothetical protein